jgi:polysaccharide chain length determinant protein (PEP-CTERM system associated)
VIPGKRYSPNDVIEAVRRRRRWIAVPFVVLTTVAFVWVMSLSHNYRSVAMLQVLPESAANSLVRSAAQPTVGDRLSSIVQETLTRTRLEQIIRDLDLYPALRRSTVMEAVVKQMRADITFQTQMADRNVFELGYTSKSPQMALTVATRLTSLFLGENAKTRGQRAEATTEFVEAQLTAARAQLEDQERKVEAYQIRHAGELPSQLQSNIQELNNSQLQLRQLVESINRERDQRLFLQRQLELVGLFDESAASGSSIVPGLASLAGEGAGSVSTVDELETARAQLKALELRLTPEHPDVQRARRVVARLEQKATDGKADPSTPEASRSRTRQDLRVRQIQAQIDLSDRQIANRQDDERQLRARIAGYTSRIDKAPMRQSELVVLTRDYEDTKRLYSSLLQRQQEASMAANLERQEIGDRFRIIEPARLPEEPSGPSRRNYFLLSLLAALGLSLGLAAAVELRDTSLRTEDDITVSLRLPVLATIPVLNRTAPGRSR